MGVMAQHGYLILADISGYTSFVADTELEHAHDILSDLLGTICARLETLLTLHKLEGDAVFVYAPEARVARPETLLELVESTYAAFRDRQAAIKRSTTCTCNACRRIPSLDLKFIVHHGDYILQQVREVKEMIGSDVNLVHRLLKNHVTEATGWKAYLLITQKGLEHLSMELADAYTQSESYEHLGEVMTHSVNLHERYNVLIATRQHIITAEQADASFTIDFPTPPPLTWEWLHEPTRRNLWGGGVTWTTGSRPKGRTESGASNHCAHGKSVVTQVILDWRPFDYATTESLDHGKRMMSETTILTALPGGGTRLQNNLVVDMPLPAWIRRPLVRFMMNNKYKYAMLLQKAARLAGEEMLQEQ